MRVGVRVFLDYGERLSADEFFKLSDTNFSRFGQILRTFLKLFAKNKLVKMWQLTCLMMFCSSVPSSMVVWACRTFSFSRSSLGSRRSLSLDSASYRENRERGRQCWLAVVKKGQGHEKSCSAKALGRWFRT